MLRVCNLYCGYNDVDIVKDISLSVSNGEVFSIVGPNGCGKSTLLKALINILPFKGSVLIDEKEVLSFSRKTLAAKIALLGQAQAVYFPYTVRKTIALGRYAYTSGWLKTLTRHDNAIIADIIVRLGLEDIQDKLISELSGGQLQRVFLARAFAQTPDIILLDEPTNHLDLKYQLDLLMLLKNWVKENNKIAVIVLHDLNLVQNYADTALIMCGGQIVSCGKPSTVFTGAALRDVYGTDVRGFMLDSLAKWQAQ